jgi:hypothetical protein
MAHKQIAAIYDAYEPGNKTITLGACPAAQRCAGGPDRMAICPVPNPNGCRNSKAARINGSGNIILNISARLTRRRRRA